MAEHKQHFYNLCFLTVENSITQYQSVQNSFTTKNVTICRINSTKEKADVKADATLISCSYLGCMTYKEFTEG